MKVLYQKLKDYKFYGIIIMPGDKHCLILNETPLSYKENKRKDQYTFMKHYPILPVLKKK